MKKIFLTIVVIPTLLLAVPRQGLCRETALHERMTESAAVSSPGLQGFLRECFGGGHGTFLYTPTIQFDASVFGARASSPIDWMKEGSRMEDDEEVLGFSGVRSGNHFYEPLSEQGL